MAIPPGLPPRQPVGRGQPLNRAQPKAQPGRPARSQSKISPPTSPPPAQSGRIANERIRRADLGKSVLAFDKIDFTNPRNFFIEFGKLAPMDQFLIKSNLIELYKNFDKDWDFESKSSQAYLKNLISHPVTPEKLNKAQKIVVSIRPYIEDNQKLKEKIELSNYEVTLDKAKEEQPRYADKLKLTEGWDDEWNDRAAQPVLNYYGQKGVEQLFKKLTEEKVLTADEAKDVNRIIEHFFKALSDPMLSKNVEYIKDIIRPLLRDDTEDEFFKVKLILSYMPDVSFKAKSPPENLNLTAPESRPSRRSSEEIPPPPPPISPPGSPRVPPPPVHKAPPPPPSAPKAPVAKPTSKPTKAAPKAPSTVNLKQPPAQAQYAFENDEYFKGLPLSVQRGYIRQVEVLGVAGVTNLINKAKATQDEEV